MQRDSADVGVTRTAWLEVGGRAEFGERIIGPFFSCQNKAERIMERRVRARSSYCRPQHPLSVAVSAKLPIKIRQIDRRGSIWGAEPQRCLVFAFCITGEPTTRVEIPECRAGLGPVCIEPLSSYKLLRRAFEGRAIGCGLV